MAQIPSIFTSCLCKVPNRCAQPPASPPPGSSSGKGTPSLPPVAGALLGHRDLLHWPAGRGRARTTVHGRFYGPGPEVAHFSALCSTGSNVATKPHLIAREAGKCSLAPCPGRDDGVHDQLAVSATVPFVIVFFFNYRRVIPFRNVFC